MPERCCGCRVAPRKTNEVTTDGNRYARASRCREGPDQSPHLHRARDLSARIGAALRPLLALAWPGEPAAGEDPLQFLLIDLGLDEDAATDQALLGIY